MNIKTIWISIIGMAWLLMSCENEETKALYHSYGIAYPVENESYAFKVVTDMGNVLIPNTGNYRVDTLTRVYARFTMVDDADRDKDSIVVDFKYMDDILYKTISMQDTSLGNDPIYVRNGDIWASTYNKVLNVKFAFDGGEEQHLINLYLDPLRSHEDTVYLEFRHNANADPSKYRYDGLVSFDMSPLDTYLADKDSIPYQVSINRGTTNAFLDSWTGIYKGE